MSAMTEANGACVTGSTPVDPLPVDRGVLMAPLEHPRIRLLIVDDDELLRQTLAKRFERQGMTVTAAGSGAEAIARAGEGRLDVALLDLHLPDTSGIDVLGRLKEIQPELEALMLTAH